MNDAELKKVCDFLRGNDPLNNAVECTTELLEVDWKAVSEYEIVAPYWLDVPELEAKRRCRYMEEWRKRVNDSYPDEATPDHEWFSYLVVFEGGNDSFEYQCHNRRGTHRYMWVEANLDVMDFLCKDVVAIYQSESIEHASVGRLWAAHHRLFAQEPQSNSDDWVGKNCMMVQISEPD